MLKERYCWNCGKSLGAIETKFYDRRDTCGARECERESRDAYREEREDAHRYLDDRMGW